MPIRFKDGISVDGSVEVNGVGLGANAFNSTTIPTNNNQITNGAGYTTNVGDITGVTAGTNLTGGGTSGTVTLNMATGGAGAGVYGSTGDTTKIDTITLDAYGRVTAVGTGLTGDITGVTAGTGLSGGGTSGTVTLTNAAPNVSTNLTTSTAATTVTVNSSDGTNAILPAATTTVAGVMTGTDKSKLNGIAAGATNVNNNNQLTNGAGYITSYVNTTYTAGTGLALTGTVFSNTITNNNQLTNGAGYTSNTGDITSVGAGSYLTGGGTSGAVTLNVNASTAAAPNTVAARDGSGDISVRLIRSEFDTTNEEIGYIMTQVDTISNNYVRPSTPTEFRKAVTDDYYSNNIGDITGVTAGTNLTGGGTSGTVTLNMATGGAGAGVYGSTTDGTKLDTITLDAYGRVTGVTTGATGDIQGVTAGNGLSGGGTAGTITLSMSGSFTGNFTASGNITAYSDERLKTNIETIPNALEKVNLLRGVTFNKDGERGLGVIAQEVEKILPEVVIEGEEYKSVAYGNIVGVLIEAIKELTKEVEDLKRQIK
tara:strand:- start:9584 stop:11203 length:1620 start_codon:yes stop_codon:yes gene_type:complete